MGNRGSHGNGATTLFGALNALDGRVIAQSQNRHRHVDSLKLLLRQIDRRTPQDKTVHLIADNSATHKHPAAQKRLGKHPRLNMPTSVSWTNTVERLFRDITTARTRRGVLPSVVTLIHLKQNGQGSVAGSVAESWVNKGPNQLLAADDPAQALAAIRSRRRQRKRGCRGKSRSTGLHAIYQRLPTS